MVLGCVCGLRNILTLCFIYFLSPLLLERLYFVFQGERLMIGKHTKNVKGGSDGLE